MNKTTLIFLFLYILLGCPLLWGQPNKDTLENISQPVGYIRAEASFPGGYGISGEVLLGKNWTTSAVAYMEWGYSVLFNELYHENLFAFQNRVRYYYNWQRRLQKGRSIQNYSGNFIGTILHIPLNKTVTYFSDSGGNVLKRVRYNFFVLAYGMRRSFGKRKNWFVEGEMGPGILYSPKEQPQITLYNFPIYIQFRVGVNLWKIHSFPFRKSSSY